MQIENTVAVVTGAASGLGAATAAKFAAAGAQVVGIDLDVAKAPEVGGVTYVAADVTNAE
ncbi:MAG TPA: SDR family NAD(P)-dependent oxidoreductase, partial [Aeromicrobium sp.]|nr:SDR family NAD(P)-dependent oxidoreductase [Aeromicrobium sp.]